MAYAKGLGLPPIRVFTQQLGPRSRSTRMRGAQSSLFLSCPSETLRCCRRRRRNRLREKEADIRSPGSALSFTPPRRSPIHRKLPIRQGAVRASGRARRGSFGYVIDVPVRGGSEAVLSEFRAYHGVWALPLKIPSARLSTSSVSRWRRTAVLKGSLAESIPHGRRQALRSHHHVRHRSR